MKRENGNVRTSINGAESPSHPGLGPALWAAAHGRATQLWKAVLARASGLGSRPGFDGLTVAYLVDGAVASGFDWPPID